MRLAGLPRRLRRFALSAACVFFLHSAQAADTAPFEQFKLSNGMEVLVLPNHRVPAVSHMLWFRIGGADDPPGKSGLAHYLEHMMFRGTKTRQPGEYARIIAANGGDENAFTGHDATVYFVNIAKEHLPLVMELEADRMQNLSLTEKDALRERDVILEERRARIENVPRALLHEQVRTLLYQHYPYRISIIGWMHEMEKLTLEDAVAFYRSHYTPANAVLIVSGDITAAELKPLVQKYYGSIPAGKPYQRKRTDEPPLRAARQVELRHPQVRHPEWQRQFLAPSFAYGKTEHAMPLLALAQILGGGRASRLYQSLVVRQKLATEIEADYDGFMLGPTEFTVVGTPLSEAAIPALETAVEDEIRRIVKDGVTGEELSRAKTLLEAEAVYARDGLESMANIMGWMRMAGLGPELFTGWPEHVRAITAEQVQNAAAEVLRSEYAITDLLLATEKELHEAE